MQFPDYCVVASKIVKSYSIETILASKESVSHIKHIAYIHEKCGKN